jgi:cholesterol oxidase
MEERRPERLSRPLGWLRPHYDVVVVGSGYGGAVAAARLAGDRRRVCLLERGRELRPGDYPDTLPTVLRELQVDLPDRRLVSPTGLYDLHLGPDLGVFVGCGLGGTSLINASVALRPDPELFKDKSWPEAIRREAADGKIWTWYKKAEEALGVQRLPNGETPQKLRTLDRVGRLIDESSSLERAPMTLTFVGEHACTRCGDCVSGCDYGGAKRTLIETYLPLVRRRRAEIFTEVKVRSVQPLRGGHDPRRRWIVHFHHLGSGRDRFALTPLFVTAHTVVLAAGALGTPEILMRSQREWDLPVSSRLGARFSGNGDLLAFSHNNRERVNAIGYGPRSPHGADVPGPCISGYVRLARSGALLEDGVIPGALSPILSLGFLLAQFADGRSPRRAGGPGGLSLWRVLEDSLRGGIASTQTFLAMVDDREYGELVWEHDRVCVRWPGAGQSQPYRDLERALRQAAKDLDGAYVPSPFGPMTVHPLGGCVMGDGAHQGVVDNTGAVFDPDKRDGRRPIHEGLYVCDASILPVALRTNPLLTITAFAERAADRIGAGLP